jgi:hypothetical protein
MAHHKHKSLHVELPREPAQGAVEPAKLHDQPIAGGVFEHFSRLGLRLEKPGRNFSGLSLEHLF